MEASAAHDAVRDEIVERLVGDIGDPEMVLATARAMAERALPVVKAGLAERLGSPVTMEIGLVALARMAALKPENTLTSALCVGASPSSPDAIGLSLDGAAVAILVSMLFGGDPDLPMAPITRPLSPTEMDVASLAFEAVASAVNGNGQRAFDFVQPLPLPVTGVELAKRQLRDGPAIRVEFSLQAAGSTGTIVVMMPQRVLLKHRSDRAAPAPGQAGPETDWGIRFGEEIKRSSVRLEATMPLGNLTLGQIAAFTEGQVIELPAAARTQARLSAKQKLLFLCEFGKLGQNYTVRVSESFDAQQDLLDGLMAGRPV
jgi:flagellar motor switch protein FliM